MTELAITPLDPAEINYEIHGAGNETLVMIHGLGSALPTFENVLPALAEDFQVLVYDQRGHGMSPAVGTDYSTEVLSGDLQALLDHLELERVHLLGHSLGARTAVRFAERYPERVESLIVEDMELQPRSELDEEGRSRMLAEYLRRRERFIDRTYPNREALEEALETIVRPDQIDGLIGRRVEARDDGSFRLLFRPETEVLYSAQANSEDLLEPFAAIEVPVLVMLADANQSAATPDGVKQLKGVRPETDVVHVAGAGHSIHRTNEAEFVELVKDFIEQL